MSDTLGKKRKHVKDPEEIILRRHSPKRLAGKYLVPMRVERMVHCFMMDFSSNELGYLLSFCQFFLGMLSSTPEDAFLEMLYADLNQCVEDFYQNYVYLYYWLSQQIYWWSMDFCFPQNVLRKAIILFEYVVESEDRVRKAFTNRLQVPAYPLTA
jgi:hypothetical protein